MDYIIIIIIIILNNSSKINDYTKQFIYIKISRMYYL